MFPTDVKNADNSEFDQIDVIEFLKMKNYRAQMCVGVTSNMSRLTANAFGTGTE